MKKGCVFFIGLLLAGVAHAGQVQVKFVRLHKAGTSWNFAVTLRHADSGWDHYADAWRVVGEDGKVYGTRILYHPHEHEQPFTRSLSGVNIPAGVQRVIVEAHDKVHGWSPDRVVIDLDTPAGRRYRIGR